MSILPYLQNNYMDYNLKGPSQPLEIKYMYQYIKIDNSKAIVIFIFKQISLFLKDLFKKK